MILLPAIDTLPHYVITPLIATLPLICQFHACCHYTHITHYVISHYHWYFRHATPFIADYHYYFLAGYSLLRWPLRHYYMPLPLFIAFLIDYGLIIYYGYYSFSFIITLSLLYCFIFIFFIVTSLFQPFSLLWLASPISFIDVIFHTYTCLHDWLIFSPADTH